MISSCPNPLHTHTPSSDSAHFIFKSAEILTSFSSWASVLSAPQSAFLDLNGPRIIREEELEFLLSEVKKEVGEKQNWIDMCHDLQHTQTETLGQKSREIQRLQQENARLQQENTTLHDLQLEAKVAAVSPKTMIVNDIHDQKLHLPI